uniref:Uncharacterized protein n=1 Tax=Rhizophora mucronata TaxID=61149 RepID=A0A2P2PF66_RHIMU
MSINDLLMYGKLVGGSFSTAFGMQFSQHKFKQAESKGYFSNLHLQ